MRWPLWQPIIIPNDHIPIEIQFILMNWSILLEYRSKTLCLLWLTFEVKQERWDDTIIVRLISIEDWITFGYCRMEIWKYFLHSFAISITEFCTIPSEINLNLKIAIEHNCFCAKTNHQYSHFFEKNIRSTRKSSKRVMIYAVNQQSICFSWGKTKSDLCLCVHI